MTLTEIMPQVAVRAYQRLFFKLGPAPGAEFIVLVGQGFVTGRTLQVEFFGTVGAEDKGLGHGRQLLAVQFPTLAAFVVQTYLLYSGHGAFLFRVVLIFVHNISLKMLVLVGRARGRRNILS
jgi:hypothetical protein